MKMTTNPTKMIPPSNHDKPPLESAKRSIVVDMSPAAIDRRMRDMDQLWELWRYLRRFKPVASCGDKSECRNPKSETNPKSEQNK